MFQIKVVEWNEHAFYGKFIFCIFYFMQGKEK
jgi:hypothetical protein